MPARVGTEGQAVGNSRLESAHPAFDQEPGHNRVGLMRRREKREGGGGSRRRRRRRRRSKEAEREEKEENEASLLSLDPLASICNFSSIHWIKVANWEIMFEQDSRSKALIFLNAQIHCRENKSERPVDALAVKISITHSLTT